MRWFGNKGKIRELVQMSDKVVWVNQDKDLRLVCTRISFLEWDSKEYAMLSVKSATVHELNVIMCVQMSTFSGFRFFRNDGRELQLGLFGNIKVI